MKSSLSWVTTAIAAVITVLSFADPAPLFADSYKIVNLFSDNGYFFYGGDDAGHVSLTWNTCDTPSGFCYVNFLDGNFINTTTTAPSFVPSQGGGAPCLSGLPAGAVAYHSVCSNGREAFLGYIPPLAPDHPGVYAGPNASDLISTKGSGIFIYMDGRGDIVWNDPVQENWMEAIDLDNVPVPEPTSILLLGTGILFVASAIRRRFCVNSLRCMTVELTARQT